MSTTVVAAPPKTSVDTRRNLHIRSGDWRLLVLTRVDAMRTEIRIHPPRTVDPTFLQERILAPLDRAQLLASKDSFDLWERWTGSQIEAAWLALRTARKSILQTSPDDIALARATATIASAKGRVDDANEVLDALKKEVGSTSADPARLRELTAAVDSLAHDASDAQHRSQRSFQNQLRVLAVGIGVICVAVVVALFCMPGAPAGMLSAPAGLSAGGAALVALLCGGVGALVSAIPSLSTFPGSGTSPFNPIREQAGLKIALGCLSGIVGPILIAAGLTLGTDGAPKPGTMAGFVMLAALCGAQQEALSRFADRKANDVSPKP